MFSLEIENKILSFKDIKQVHLPLILNWYNMVDDFKFATGLDTPVTLEYITRKYAEAAICSNEFFSGIYLKSKCKMIGILKGRIHYENSDTIWISSIVIDKGFQNMGLGSESINLLLDYLKKNNDIKSSYLAVIEENVQGRRFWEKHGFQEIRKIDNHFKLQNKPQNVIIMGRQL